MNDPQPVRNELRPTTSEPLTLDFVLTEVVRILDEERAESEGGAVHQLAA